MPIWQTCGSRANSSSRFANFINRSTVIDDWLTSWLSDGSSWRICTRGSRSTVKDRSYTWNMQKWTCRLGINISILLPLITLYNYILKIFPSADTQAVILPWIKLPSKPSKMTTISEDRWWLMMFQTWLQVKHLHMWSTMAGDLTLKLLSNYTLCLKKSSHL